MSNFNIFEKPKIKVYVLAITLFGLNSYSNKTMNISISILNNCSNYWYYWYQLVHETKKDNKKDII